MKKYCFSYLFVSALLLGLICCGKKDDINNSDDKYPETEQKQPVTGNEKPCYLWVDASANFERFSSRDNIKTYVKKAKETGFTHLVVDVRPVVGDVMYKSELVDELVTWKGVTRDASQDYLQDFLDEGKAAGIKVFASMNVFSGGHNYVDRGVVYRDPEMAKLTSLLNMPEGFVDIKNKKDRFSAFFNPVNPKVQQYCLNLIKELVRKYDIDGIILDRCRFDGLDSDFSTLSRATFEERLGHPIINWPESVFEWKKINGSWARNPGPLYKSWLEWRAQVIFKFFEKARDAVKEIKDDVQFGTYTGAWYPTYYDVGANWASQKYDPLLDTYSNWMYSTNYKNYGYAGLLDVYMTGVYYNNIAGNGWYTIEGGLDNARRIVCGDVPVMGSLYAEMFKNNPSQMTDAVKMCLTHSDGLMMFDIVQVIKYNLWYEIKTGIDLAN